MVLLHNTNNNLWQFCADLFQESVALRTQVDSLKLEAERLQATKAQLDTAVLGAQLQLRDSSNMSQQELAALSDQATAMKHRLQVETRQLLEQLSRTEAEVAKARSELSKQLLQVQQETAQVQAGTARVNEELKSAVRASATGMLFWS